MSNKHGHFLTNGVHLHHIGGTRAKAVLMAPVIFVDKHNRRHTAHPGLITDGRSFGLFYYLIGTPYDGRHLEACIIHDWYCAKAAMLTGDARRVVRGKADILFGECLESLDVPTWKQKRMVKAVQRHARAVQNKPASHWKRNFVSEAASHLGADNPWKVSYG